MEIRLELGSSTLWLKIFLREPAFCRSWHLGDETTMSHTVSPKDEFGEEWTKISSKWNKIVGNVLQLTELSMQTQAEDILEQQQQHQHNTKGRSEARRFLRKQTNKQTNLLFRPRRRQWWQCCVLGPLALLPPISRMPMPKYGNGVSKNQQGWGGWT